MYKTSQDRRFQKNKREIRRAYLDLVIEKETTRITISDIAARADINRMTFYAHYDVVEDVFAEFVDDMKQEIGAQLAGRNLSGLNEFFEILNVPMYREERFFRYVCQSGKCPEFEMAFINAISELLKMTIAKDGKLGAMEHAIVSNLAAVSISYAYFDWLAGKYGDTTLDEVISVATNMLGGITF